MQPIDSDRVTVTLTSDIAFPMNSQAIIAGFDVNDPLKGFQPRAYAPGYTLPEKVLSYTASIQQKLPCDTVLTVAYVGSQGRNLFLRAWTNVMTGVTMNRTTGAGIASAAVRQQVRADGLQDQRRHGPLRFAADDRQPPLQQGLTIGSQWTWGHSLGDTGGSNEAQTTVNPFDFNRTAATTPSTCATASTPPRCTNCRSDGTQVHAERAARFDLLLGGWELGGVVERPHRFADRRDHGAQRHRLPGQLDRAIVSAPDGGCRRQSC